MSQQLTLFGDHRPDCKVCSSCGKTLSLKKFHLDKSKKDGRVSRCRKCVNKAPRKNPAYKGDKAKIHSSYSRWWNRVGEVPITWARYAIRRIKKRATARGIDFKLSPRDLLPLPEICPLLGIALNYASGKGRGGFKDDSPSVDRIDNTKGYTKDNVWIISTRANSIKRDATLEELESIAGCLRGAVEKQKRGVRPW